MHRRVLFVLAVAGCASGNNAGPDATETPADAFVVPDSGCGALPCDAIYVARSGNDTAAGSKAAPMKTIAAAIVKASAALPPLAVFVKAGTYPETFAMKPGVSVYGGFDDTWAQNAAVTTEVAGATSPTVTIDNITIPTVLDGLTIKSADATTPGSSSVAITITSSKLIELRDLDVQPGIGAAGTDGNDGTTGASGNAGASGNPGRENSGAVFCDSHGVPPPGGGGSSACGRSGGAGGSPGTGSSGGAAGGAGAGGTPGGAGAPGESADGSAGGNGAAGGNGNSGTAGIEVGMFAGITYNPSSGAGGTGGGNGNGGGGGGGGGGGTTDCDSTGSSGGGGGAGGCGGTAGTSGTGGGGSFGVVASNSTVVLKSSKVTANRGGAGGRGGRGAAGGSGGAGGPGGPYGGSSEQDDGGMGAAGGSGGRGGNGGHGGGGGGGPSAGLVCLGTATISIPQTTVNSGTGGDGGPSVGNAGAAGVSTRAIGCAFF